MVCSDLEALLLPLLSILYNASGRTPSQMYMLLIIILILSQDAAFARNIHTIALVSVPWYKDRLLHNTTLGTSPTVAASLRCVVVYCKCLTPLCTLIGSSPHCMRNSGMHQVIGRADQRMCCV